MLLFQVKVQVITALSLFCGLHMSDQEVDLGFRNKARAR